MKTASSVKPWLFVAAGFVLLIAIYVVVFRVAHLAQIRDVPLATKGARP